MAWRVRALICIGAAIILILMAVVYCFQPIHNDLERRNRPPAVEMPVLDSINVLVKFPSNAAPIVAVSGKLVEKDDATVQTANELIDGKEYSATRVFSGQNAVARKEALLEVLARRAETRDGFGEVMISSKIPLGLTASNEGRLRLKEISAEGIRGNHIELRPGEYRFIVENDAGTNDDRGKSH
jgi:hypothetical protein